jgi:hypothetical protein
MGPLSGDESADLGVGGQEGHHPFVVLAQGGPGQPGQATLGVIAGMCDGHQSAQ